MMSKKNIILGIGGLLGHDANAALIVDGILISSSQEERHSRKKHDATFPEKAIENCLSRADIKPEDVDFCVFAEKPFQAELFKRTGKPSGSIGKMLGNVLPGKWDGLYQQQARSLFPSAQFKYVFHHLSHAAAAFVSSPVDRAAFLCIDGKGEDVNSTFGKISDQAITPIQEQQGENGLGCFYTLVTHFLGFHSFGSEYKVMGLAPYGTPRFIKELKSLLTEDENGFCQIKYPVAFHYVVLLESIRYVEEALKIKRREATEPTTEVHADIAASLQVVFEESIFKMAHYVRKHTEEKKLLLCGGCAQNCVAAGKLRRAKIFDNVYNSPVGGDMGSGLGAALCFLKWGLKESTSQIKMKGYYLGDLPGQAPKSIQSFHVAQSTALHRETAMLLEKGNVVGWIRGGMELGARALGARSILADPRVPGMQSTLNLKVKFRESFRPFAPAILADYVDEWFEEAAGSDYMQFVSYLRKDKRIQMPDDLKTLKERLDFKRCEIASVIHVDYSARVQTVDKEVHPDFYQLITEFYALTGVPIIINTSFNVSGQPIVQTATEAWECFIHTDMDYLVLNDEIYKNPNQLTREEKLEWLKQFSKSA